MAVGSILALGSPIKDQLAPSMPGPAAAGAVSTSSPVAVGGTSKVAALAASAPTLTGGGPTAASLAAGTTSTVGTHLGAGVGMTAAKTTAVSTVFGSLFYSAAVVAVGYVGYRAAKALWESTTKALEG